MAPAVIKLEMLIPVQEIIILDSWASLSFSVEKSVVHAKTRVLKARYTMELAQDLRKAYGMLEMNS